MKKSFKFYAAIWAALLAIWCIIVFLVRPINDNYVKYDAVFWTACSFILLAFLGNLFCAYLAFQAKNKEKLFLNLPLITLSYSSLILMLIVGSVLMLIPDFPAWVAAIICVLILGFNVIAVIKASWAAAAAGNVDDRIRVQTAYIKNLTADAGSILSKAADEAVKADCMKVYDAVRFSDPMSSEALSVIEAKITVKMDELSSAVTSNDAGKVKNAADELVSLIAERNNRCKVLK